jgi:hypothetical protein
MNQSTPSSNNKHGMVVNLKIGQTGTIFNYLQHRIMVSRISWEFDFYSTNGEHKVVRGTNVIDLGPGKALIY